ncbi:MAG: DUF3011 domain-containing protein, partial [Frankiaceae bacterium]|nr:DUF3011 domain-containing protein [Arenimonas sp.]
MNNFLKTGFVQALVLALGSLAGSAQAAYGGQDGYYDSRSGYGDSGYANSGYANSGYGNSGYGNNRDMVRCESRNGRTTSCRMDTRGGVRLVTQTSQSACVRGRTWGVSGNSV